MKKSIKVLFDITHGQKYLEGVVAKQAELYGVHGVGQQIKPGVVQLYLVGDEEQVDNFLDCLYTADTKYSLKNINIETCTADRSFRGIFRIVE